jgi:hypothetical protein
MRPLCCFVLRHSTNKHLLTATLYNKIPITSCQSSEPATGQGHRHRSFEETCCLHIADNGLCSFVRKHSLTRVNQTTGCHIPEDYIATVTHQQSTSARWPIGSQVYQEHAAFPSQLLRISENTDSGQPNNPKVLYFHVSNVNKQWLRF